MECLAQDNPFTQREHTEFSVCAVPSSSGSQMVNTDAFLLLRPERAHTCLLMMGKYSEEK